MVLRVRDLDAALGFYVGALGCAEERRIDALGLVQLRAGASLIDLVPVDSPLGKAGGGTPDAAAKNVDHFCLRIEPFDAELSPRTCAHTASSPVTWASATGPTAGRAIHVPAHPDGNVVELKGPPVRKGRATSAPPG